MRLSKFGVKKSGRSFDLIKIFLVGALTVSVSCAFLYNLNLGFVLPVEAVGTSIGGGVASLDKVYLDDQSEVKSLITAPGDYITVRLKYNNTSSQSATSVVLSDALPSAKFDYIPGSLRNCLLDNTNCVSLSDGLFTGLNLITTPSAGLYGFIDSAVTGNLEFGRYRYAHLVTCSQTSGIRESFIQSIDNTSIFVPSCTSVSGGSTVLDYATLPILGQRYIHQTVCIFGSGEREVFIQSIDNSASFTPDCSGFSGSNVDTSSTLDLLANRYLHQTICDLASGEKEVFAQALNNSASFTPSCASLGGSATLSSSATIDLFSSANGAGFIEYQMKSNLNEDFNSALNADIGEYGTSPTLVSPSFISALNNTLTDNMANSLSLKVYCDQISPTGGERNLSLSDAELRAGQDFRCNYQASICPVVFEDVNTNGAYNDGVDTLNVGVGVELQSADGNTTYDTITTDNTITQCFENLLHGREYRVIIPSAPTGISTTGGETQNIMINYKTTAANAEFGYSNGSLLLNVPSDLVLPTLQVASTVTPVSGTISPIQVIDTRLANPGWTLTATVNDFVKVTDQNQIIEVGDQFMNTPQSVRVNTGQTGGISIGNQKTVSSTSDVMEIFSGSPNSSKGDYEIDADVTLFVPSFISIGIYNSNYIYTII
jgi:hypothetical protein